ncbi:MAG: hypothetical protein KDD63_17255, partial [Bacteroidetes bacterium]|nr:hypothetical protein [Bacteroidota bacterium]
IYGIGGLGKTALATRFATNYQNRAFKVIQFFGKVEVPTILDDLMGHLKTELSTTQSTLINQLEQFLKSDTPAPQKLQALIDHYLTNRKIILLFDNFETNQEIDGEATDQIDNENLKELLTYLIQHLPQSCYLLLTTRYLPKDLPLTPLNLDDMKLSEVYRLLALEEGLSSRLKISEIRSIQQELGGHPFAFGLVKTYLKENPQASWQQLEPELKVIGEDARARRNLMLDRLWELLSREEQDLLRIASIFRTPFPPEALRELSSYSEEVIAQVLRRLNTLSFCFVGEKGEVYVHRLAAGYVLQTHLSSEVQRELHHKTAVYLEKKKAESLEDYMEAKWHYLKADIWEEYASLSFGLEKELRLQGHFPLAKMLNQEVLDAEVGEKNKA